MDGLTLPEDRFLDVAGVRARYWQVGAGPPLLLLHGLAGFVEHWLLNLEALAARHTVYALDLLGHGRSGKPRGHDYSLAGHAAFVRGFAAAAGLQAPDVAGHSFGGAIALKLAEQGGLTGGRLLLIDSTGLGREISPLIRLLATPLLGALLWRLGYPSSPARYARLHPILVPNGTLGSEALVARFFAVRREGNRNGTVRRTLRQFVSLAGQRRTFYAPLRAGLGQVRQRTLVVWGEEDPALPVAHAQVAAAGMKDAQIEIFPARGHAPHQEDPARFNAVATAFFDG